MDAADSEIMAYAAKHDLDFSAILARSVRKLKLPLRAGDQYHGLMSQRRGSIFALISASIACWLERQAAARIEYLKVENRVLRTRLGRRRIVFPDAERRTLPTLAKEVDRKALNNLDAIVTPATLLRWHRKLVAHKWTFLDRRRPGRPRTHLDIEQLIVSMAKDNPSWGYTRIQGFD